MGERPEVGDEAASGGAAVAFAQGAVKIDRPPAEADDRLPPDVAGVAVDGIPKTRGFARSRGG